MVAVSVGRFLLKLYFWTPPGPHVYSHPFMPSSWLTRHHSESCSWLENQAMYGRRVRLTTGNRTSAWFIIECLATDTTHEQPPATAMDPTYPLAPIANFVGCFLIITTLSSLCYRPWNTGVFMLAVYVFLQSLVVGVNAIVWSDNAGDVAPVWCDISEQYIVSSIAHCSDDEPTASHIYIFEEVSIPACLFLITRRLFNIVRLRSSLTDTKSQREVCSSRLWLLIVWEI